MKLYRFSPIEDEDQFSEALRFIHQSTHELCFKSYGEYLPVRGVMVIFCHYDSEYKYLCELSDRLTNKTDSFNGKYYRLKEPITIAGDGNTPEAIYNYLYIRKPDPWRSQVGDIDFVLTPENKYAKLKESLAKKETKNMRLFPRYDLDLIELHDPDIDVLAYIASNRI